MLQWLFVVSVIVLLMVSLSLSPLQGSYDIAKESSAMLRAQEIVGIINILRISPVNTSHKYTLPKLECTIKIEHNFVNVTITSGSSRQDYILYLIEPVASVVIKGEMMQCDKEKKLPFVFKKVLENGEEIIKVTREV